MRRSDICLYLGPAARAELQALITNRNTSRKLVWRAEIILATADGHGTLEIMRRARTSKPTVWRWQQRYLDEGVAGLSDQYGRKKRGRGRLIGRTKGGMNTKLHAICDSQGRPINLFVTAGQVSDYIGARALLGSLPNVDWLLGDRGYDANWFREALKDKGIKPCIPGRKRRKTAVKYDKRRYKRRNRIEIMFGRLKDWRRVATRYDRCPKVFLSAIALAAIVIWAPRFLTVFAATQHRELRNAVR